MIGRLFPIVLLICFINRISTDRDKPKNLTFGYMSAYYKDQFDNYSAYVTNGGSVTFNCGCTPGKFVELIFPDKNATSALRCPRSHDSLITWKFNMSKVDIGVYWCREDQKLSDQNITIDYKFCLQRSSECSKIYIPYNSSFPSYCISIGNITNGTNLERIPDNGCNSDITEKRNYCPGGYRSFCEAVNNGISGVNIIQPSNISCGLPAETCSFIIDGFKAYPTYHHFAQFKPMNYRFLCSKDSPCSNSYTNVILKRKDLTFGVSEQLQCDGNTTGRELDVCPFTEYAPVKLHMLVEWSQLGYVDMHLILFKTGLTWRKIRDEDDILRAIQIKMPENLDDEFQLNFNITRNDSPIEMDENYQIPIFAPGTFNVEMYQTFISCAPRIRYLADPVRTSIYIRLTDIFPTAKVYNLTTLNITVPNVAVHNSTSKHVIDSDLVPLYVVYVICTVASVLVTLVIAIVISREYCRRHRGSKRSVDASPANEFPFTCSSYCRGDSISPESHYAANLHRTASCSSTATYAVIESSPSSMNRKYPVKILATAVIPSSIPPTPPSLDSLPSRRNRGDQSVSIDDMQTS